MSEENSPLEQDKLGKSSLVVGSMTMLSRVLGLIRDIVIARIFGASAGSDAFFVAFKIPNFLRRLFAEGAFSQSFVPVLSEYRSQQDHNQVKMLVDRVAGTLALVLFIISVVAVVGAPLLIMLFAPGFVEQPEKLELATYMLRLTFPYLFFISLTAFAAGILNSYGRFLIPSVTPVLLNLSLIGAALLLSPRIDQPITALAWGVMFAGLIQFLFQLPFLARLRLLPRPKIDRKHEGVKRILVLMVPALFGVSVSQINLLLDTVLASFLQTGSVSWLYFSDRLVELPLGVFGIAIATVILPNLSRHHATQNSQHFSHTLDWGLRLILLIGAPAALALVVLAEPLIITLFHYGEMQDKDVVMTAMSLRAYALGLLAFMLIKVLATGYFSRQDTRTPVSVGIKAMIANMVLNLALIVPLQHVGLALATSLSAFLNAGLLFLGLYRQKYFSWQPGWSWLIVRMMLANCAMIVTVYFIMGETQQWIDWNWWDRAWHILLICGVGIVVYFAVLLIFGMRSRDFHGPKLNSNERN